MDIHQLTVLLSKYPELRIAILFGSMAGERVRPDSDLDLALAADRPLDASLKLAVMDDISELTGRTVDVVDLKVVGEPLLGEIITKGIRILVTDQREMERLIRRHLTETEDFLPLRRSILNSRRQAWIGY
jgi:predicted nucleotidyltransferase